MSKLYHKELDLSTSAGALPRDDFADGMRVRCYGHTENRNVLLPAISGSIIFKNDGDGSVILKRGLALPVTISPDQALMVLVDGDTITRVG